MNWNRLRMNKRARKAGCIVLAAALLAVTCLPVFQREQVSFENPILEESVEDIDLLQAGEAENLTDDSRVDPSAEGNGGGQNGGESGSQGGNTPGEADEATEGADQEEKDENVESQQEPDDGPSLEDLSDTQIGGKPDAKPDGEMGQEDGNQGEEGGESAELDLGAVMYWYQYGKDPKSIVCLPNETVGKEIVTAQLSDNVLKYEFKLTGKDADSAKITGVTVSEGNSIPTKVDESGSIDVHLQADPGYQNYIFQVEALAKQKNQQGETVEQKLKFTYVIRCENGKDLTLQLTWDETDGSASSVICKANKEAVKSVNGMDLTDGQFHYRSALEGKLAKSSDLISAEYTSASGEHGKLDPWEDTIEMKAADGSNQETYYLTFTARSVTHNEDGDDLEELITYTITIVYENELDLQLVFTWFERGAIRREMRCKANGSVSGAVKNNQLSAGALPYEVTLTGKSASDARIKVISCQSASGSSGNLNPIGSVAMHLPDGGTTEVYTFRITVQVGRQKVNFSVIMEYSKDVSLGMTFTTVENGVPKTKSVTCENGKSVTAELVFDDQLTNNILPYRMNILGNDAQSVQITEVTCYHSGSITNETLGYEGQVELQLDQGKTGENSFTVKAEDETGQTYTFKINIPYKHRGENLVKIATNLTDGMEITNGTEVNLNVRAWVEDENGNTISNILATGTNGSRITVTLDGEEIPYFSASGVAQEYILIPKNPEVGDSNEHILSIYAEDQLGNYGKLELTLFGKRTQAGQVLGTAQVYIDMTVLGLGVEGPVSYEVLSEEPVSNVIPKVVWGEDTGEPFGASANTFGWFNGTMSGSVESGFYLRSLSPGNPVNAEALSGNSWDDIGPGEKEVLAYIDNRFGKGSGLASLWRCVYRNGFSLSTASSDSIGEFDYTNGSGWLYAINGAYYPGSSMSDYYLKDGDTLTLRYTLAMGWDVGSGSDGYGNAVGYCVSASNGYINVEHQMEEVVNEHGGVSYVCRCCGLEAECAHTHTECRDQGDGTHAVYCLDCGEYISTPESHVWEYGDKENPRTHSLVCTQCGATIAEPHQWVELSNTATCTEAGIRTVHCDVCGITQEQPVPAKGHQTDNQFFYDAFQHWQTCEICGEEVAESRGPHNYEYNEDEDDWYCSVCGVGHGWDMDQYLDDSNIVSATCQTIIYHCDHCNLDFRMDGVFDAYHNYVNGYCTVCGAQDHNSIAPPPEDTRRRYRGDGREENGDSQ